MAEARHRDRIRLDEPVGVDVLLPVDDREAPVDDWVAFVRRERRHCYDPGGGSDRQGESPR
ncbi:MULTISPECIES: hypothetical protein [unclassified Streptomyces]|uniref:hypothetical protein n=1 Tax=unclassified Streptomyces TaxID=2593676 RepID=UPI002E1604F6|nr:MULTISPECIES: hypothetical protein [unclassified Streptomyces]WSR22002.1 hypothetical protein OG573_24600 [Streptomyces sp. NBC_01205]